MSPFFLIVPLLVSSSLTQESRPSPSTQAAAPASQRTTGRSQDQRELLQQIQHERENRTPILPLPPQQTGRKAQTKAEKNAQDSALMVEGWPVVERTGRVVKVGDSTAFEFDAVGPGPTLATMEITKNSLLEQLESVSDAARKLFVVSGEVTRYRGRNYLTLKRVSVRAGHGNVSP